MFNVIGLSFWTDMVKYVKDFLKLFDELSNWVNMLSEFFGLVPTIFISFISIMILVGIVFGVFHLIVVIFT